MRETAAKHSCPLFLFVSILLIVKRSQMLALQFVALAVWHAQRPMHGRTCASRTTCASKQQVSLCRRQVSFESNGQMMPEPILRNKPQGAYTAERLLLSLRT